MNNRAGLNRREVVILLAVLCICVALILPGIEEMRQSARLSSCKNNMRQIALALHNYHDTYDRFPYGCIGNSELSHENRWSWNPELKSFFAADPIPPINHLLSSDDPKSVPLTFMTKWNNAEPEPEPYEIPLYPPMNSICPNGEQETDAVGQHLTTYICLAGLGKDGPLLPADHPRAGMWAYDYQRTWTDLKQSSTSTIFLVESAKDRGSWYRGGAATVRSFLADGTPIIGKNAQFGGFHRGVAMTLFVDGHVEKLSADIDPAVFRRMATIAGDPP